MAASHEDLPPSYSEEMPPTHSEPADKHLPSAPVMTNVATAAAPTTNDIIQQSRHSEGIENTAKNDGPGICNASHSFSGFIDIMHEQKKLPWGCTKILIYKLGLFIFYVANIVYPIIAAVVKEEEVQELKEHLTFYIPSISLPLVGSILMLIIIIIDLKQCLTWSSDEAEDITESNETLLRQPWIVAQNYRKKAKSVLKDYVLFSLGEFLIYPMLVFHLYGVIIERAWQFDDAISICHFVLLIYSVIMAGFYMNLYMIWLVIRVVHASYDKYDQLSLPTEMEWKRYFTPVYLTIPFAIVTAITLWLMIGIIGVRMHVDNFTLEKNDLNSTVPDTGDYDNYTLEEYSIDGDIPDTGNYKITPLTGIMIGCTVALPIVSWITNIIINKLWFYEVYSAINQLSTKATKMPEQVAWDKKLQASYNGPLSCIAAIILMTLFTVFVVGTYLLDYNSSDYEVAKGSRDVMKVLGPCFIAFFLLSNLQATIVCIIAVFKIIKIMLCGLWTLCIKFCGNLKA